MKTQVAPKDELQNVTVRICGVVRHVNGNETPRTADLHREVEVGAAGPASAAVRIAACNKMEKLGIKRRKGMLYWSPNPNKQNSVEERRSCWSLTLEGI